MKGSITSNSNYSTSTLSNSLSERKPVDKWILNDPAPWEPRNQKIKTHYHTSLVISAAWPGPDVKDSHI